jgi:hypothetical protein
MGTPERVQAKTSENDRGYWGFMFRKSSITFLVKIGFAKRFALDVGCSAVILRPSRATSGSVDALPIANTYGANRFAQCALQGLATCTA